jgi:hypothetical protein
MNVNVVKHINMIVVKTNNLYLKIVSNSMNGLTSEEDTKNIHKIISNLAKKTVIDKDSI